MAKTTEEMWISSAKADCLSLERRSLLAYYALQVPGSVEALKVKGAFCILENVVGDDFAFFLGSCVLLWICFYEG